MPLPGRRARTRVQVALCCAPHPPYRCLARARPSLQAIASSLVMMDNGRASIKIRLEQYLRWVAAPSLRIALIERAVGLGIRDERIVADVLRVTCRCSYNIPRSCTLYPVPPRRAFYSSRRRSTLLYWIWVALLWRVFARLHGLTWMTSATMLARREPTKTTCDWYRLSTDSVNLTYSRDHAEPRADRCHQVS